MKVSYFLEAVAVDIRCESLRKETMVEEERSRRQFRHWSRAWLPRFFINGLQALRAYLWKTLASRP